MPTESIIVIVVLLVTLGIILVVWNWNNRRDRVEPTCSRPPSKPATNSENDSRPLSSGPAEPQGNVSGGKCAHSDSALSRESGASEVDESAPDITMMGKVPDEVLALMQTKLSTDIELAEEEENVDVDLNDLVDDKIDEDATGAYALILVVGVARSDRGQRRLCNEDAYLVLEDYHVFVVADGMGGHNAGEVASQKAIDAIEQAFRDNAFPGTPRPEWPRRGDELVRAIHNANRVVFELSQDESEYSGMGTTVVAVRFSPNKQRAYIAHVGDSRCYRIRGGEIHQLTEDHTLGRLLGAQGKAAKHLAQAVGVRPDVAVDLTVDVPKPGDYYLVCSDGLTKMVPDDVILEIASRDIELEARCRALVDEANDRGGRDNITAVIIRIQHALEPAPA